MLAWSIIIICLLILLVYHKTKSFRSLNGLVLFSLGATCLILRILTLNLFDTNIFLKNSLSISGIWVFMFTAFALLVATIIAGRNALRFFSFKSTKLLFLYIPFAFIEQLFFMFIFLDTVNFITSENVFLTFFLTTLFWIMFHTSNDLKNFRIPVFIFGIINSVIYFYLGNIFWLTISHAILGTFMWSVFTDTNQIRNRLSKN